MSGIEVVAGLDLDDLWTIYGLLMIMDNYAFLYRMSSIAWLAFLSDPFIR